MNMTQAVWDRMTPAQRDSVRSDAGLTEQLIGLERKHVETIDRYGSIRRFWIGCSSGWIPCHIELKRRTSTSGEAVYGAPFKSIRVIK
jgi:hypothetical protein